MSTSRFFMKNLRNGKVEDYDFGHSFLESVAKVIEKKVSARREVYGIQAKNTEDMNNDKSRGIENELRNMKLAIKDLENKILSKLK